MSGIFTVTNERVADLNHNVFGNFMEFIENHISGMWAEMLWNRKYEDIGTQPLPEHWYADGIKNRAHCVISTEPMMGSACVQLLCLEDKNGDTALSQRGLAVNTGKRYIGSAWLRQKGICGPVTIAIGRNFGPFFTSYGAAIIPDVAEGWQKYNFEFLSDTDDDDAAFSIRFEGEGSLWVDAVSLMPDDNQMGWRADVVEHVKKLRPNILRFPGGCYADIYHWKNAVGDHDLRLPQDNFVWSDVPWDYKESHKRIGRHRRLTEINDVGIDDFLALCEMTGTEPLICVNLGSGTAQEAADWVEYCNGGVETRYGALRAKNGHAAPYGVKIWEIGNEMNGSHEIGYSGLDGYIAGYRRFHEAMSSVDGTLEFMADAELGEWDTTLLREIGDKMRYLDLHFYPGFNAEIGRGCPEDVYEHIFDTLKSVKHGLKTVRGEIADAGLTGKVSAAVCEWNASAGNWGENRVYMATLGNALFGACLLQEFIKNADMVKIANFSNLTNAWWSSCIRTNAGKSHVTTSFHVLSMMSNLLGAYVLRSELSGFPELPGAGMVDAVATEGDGVLSLSIVNRLPEAQNIMLDLGGMINLGMTAEITVLTADKLTALNDFNCPECVAPCTSAITIQTGGEISLPPYSYSILRIRR